jgi:N4-gp56 family major capsid protein
MATTNYGVNSTEAVKLWRGVLFEEALKATWFGKFMGPSSDDVVQRLDNTSKGAGDRITVTLRMQLTGDGVLGDATLEGNEEALVTYTTNLFIDQLRNAVRSGGKMTEQRIPWSIREEAMKGLADWWAGRFDTGLFNQVCGFTPQTNLAFTGQNAVTAPTTTYRPNSRANDQSLTTGDEFTLTFIDNAVYTAATSTPVIRPIKVDGSDMYVVVLHPSQVLQMRTNTTTGQWLDITKFAYMGGKPADNPIFTGALGYYNGCVIHQDTRITQGVNSSTGVAVSNTRRGVFMGAQAATIAFGQGQNSDNMDWNEELFDYGNQLGVSAGCIFGTKKTVFNSNDFSVITLDSYSA